LRKLIESADKYDDGSYGPLLVRLAWHSAGNFSRHDQTGGSGGATMRHAPESNHPGNAGLQVGRNLLEPLKAKYPGVSYADLYTLAGTVAIEALGGNRASWRPGRRDYALNEKPATPDGRLPDASLVKEKKNTRKEVNFIHRVPTTCVPSFIAWGSQIRRL
jgi:cytochrome c peroxidase